MSGAPLLLWSGSCALSCFWGVWHVLHLRTDTTAFEITANVDDAESLMQEFGTQAQDHDLMLDSDGTSPGKNPRTEVGGAEEKPAKKRRTSTKGATNGKDDGPQEHRGANERAGSEGHAKEDNGDFPGGAHDHRFIVRRHRVGCQVCASVLFACLLHASNINDACK